MRLRRVGLVVLGWAAFGWLNGTLILLSILSEGGGRKLSIPKFILWQTACWLMWAPLTLLVAGIARRVPVSLRWRAIAVHVLGSIVVPLIRVAGVLAATLLVAPWGSPEPTPLLTRYGNLLASFYPIDAIIYWAIVGAVTAFDSVRQLRERALHASRVETQLAQAQLANLRLQLQPHFLFNTLHAIATLVRDEDPKGAVKMIAGLSDLLRYSLDTAGCNFVALSEELEIVRRYLEIQQTRFSDRLSVTIDVEDGVRNAAVPVLLLQPLVENAIRHGIADPTRGGRLALSACGDRGDLVVEIRNDGPPLPDDWQSRQGVGLTSTRQRLAQLYGDRGRLELVNEAAGVLVRVRIPETSCAS